MTKEQLDALRGHTPGPWVLMINDGNNYDNEGPYKTWEAIEADGREVVTGAESSLWESTIPDARLIAAAPDLLAYIDKQQAKIDRLTDQVTSSRAVINRVQIEIQELYKDAEMMARALDNIEVMVEDEETEIRWTARNALDAYRAAYPKEVKG